MVSYIPNEELDTTTMVVKGLDWRSTVSSHKEEMIKKSVFALKLKNTDIGFTSKGIACAIKARLPHSKNEEYFLLTHSKVVSHADFSNGQTFTADRYCSNYPKHKENHRIEISNLPSDKEIDHFTFLPLDKTPEFCLVHDQRGVTAHEESLFACTFVNKTFVKVKYEYNKEKLMYEYTEIVPPTVEDELSMEKLVGAPVIADDNSESPLVVGVLGCFEKQTIRPILFGKHPFEQRKLKQPEHNESIDPGDKHNAPSANTASESFSQESVLPRDKVDSSSPSENCISRQAETNVSQDSMRCHGRHQDGISVAQGAMNSTYEARASDGNKEIKCSEHHHIDSDVNSATKCLGGVKINEGRPVQEEEAPVSLKHVDLAKIDKASSSMFDRVCIREKRIKILDEDMWKELRMKLDPKRDLGGDFRTLAGKLGYDMEKIWFFEAQKSPTDCLLQDWSPKQNQGTVKQLCKALHESKRDDVVELIEDWITEKGCSCEACGDLK